MDDEKNGLMEDNMHRRRRALMDKWSQFDTGNIKGWKSRKINFLEGIEDDWARGNVAQLLENQLHHYKRMDEATRATQVGSFEKFAFPIIKAVYANLVAADWVSVQPLDVPVGLIFYFNVIAGSNKGNIKKGDALFDAITGPGKKRNYSNEVVEEEFIGTGTGAVKNYTETISYTPIRPSTVSFTDGSQTITDDGQGNLVGDIDEAGANEINYATGVFDLRFASNVGASDTINVDYEYNQEASLDGVPQVELQLTSAPVQARRDSLRARWSIEAQQDLQAYHGISAEAELVAYMTNEILKEINYRILQKIFKAAGAGNTVFDAAAPTGVPFKLHRETFFDSLVKNSNLIFDATQRGEGTWIVVGTKVANILEAMDRFSKIPAPAGIAGVRKTGTLGDWTIYKDPTLDDDRWVMGYKGQSFLDTGYVYAPYLGIYTTDTITLDDMLARKGMAVRTGHKVVNRFMYATGTVTSV